MLLLHGVSRVWAFVGGLGFTPCNLHKGRKEGEMELLLPLCSHSLTTGYFHLLEVLPKLAKLPKSKLGKSLTGLHVSHAGFMGYHPQVGHLHTLWLPVSLSCSLLLPAVGCCLLPAG